MTNYRTKAIIFLRLSAESLYLKNTGYSLEKSMGFTKPHMGSVLSQIRDGLSLLTADGCYLPRDIMVKTILLGNPIAESIEQSLTHFKDEKSMRGRFAQSATRAIQAYYQGNLLEISSQYINDRFPSLLNRMHGFSQSPVGKVLFSERLRSCIVMGATLAGISFAPIYLLPKIFKRSSGE